MSISYISINLSDSGCIAEVIATGYKPLCHHPPPRTHLCFTTAAPVSPYSME